MNTDREREYREEAERLKLLPREDQRAVVEMIGLPANDPKVPKVDRLEARQRVRALKKLLKLKPGKRKRT